jgi:hypothetical protein
VGKVGESLIANWLKRRGYNVLPAYEIAEPEFKGPRILSARGDLVAPDLLAFNFDAPKTPVLWCEAKGKAAFTWHRISSSYQDGIDKQHWLDYLELRRRTPWDLWLLFLHAPGGLAKDNPPGMVPPSGLFGGEILRLAERIDHESDRWGKGGMVYWRCSDLTVNGKPLATYDEVRGKADLRADRKLEI